MEPSYRRCPYCAEHVHLAAIVCKHCHRDLRHASFSRATILRWLGYLSLVLSLLAVWPFVRGFLLGVTETPAVTEAVAPAPDERARYAVLTCRSGLQAAKIALSDASDEVIQRALDLAHGHAARSEDPDLRTAVEDLGVELLRPNARARSNAAQLFVAICDPYVK